MLPEEIPVFLTDNGAFSIGPFNHGDARDRGLARTEKAHGLVLATTDLELDPDVLVGRFLGGCGGLVVRHDFFLLSGQSDF